MVVAGYNLSALAGSRVVLQCVSGRMVWTKDGVKDRQRVVHWDMYRAYPDYAMERVLDMFSAGEQRVYNSYNTGRVTLSPTAFRDGNFSLVIKGNSGYNGRTFRAVHLALAAFLSCGISRNFSHTFSMVPCVTTDVTMNDRGLYSCNLHHLYCHLYEMVRVQLNVTKSRT